MPALTSEVIGGMITPALLISATGTLVLSTSNRLSRVVDRVRALTTEAERSLTGTPPGSAPSAEEARDPRRTVLISRQLERLTRRALMLRASMTALYASIGLFIGTSLAVGLAVLMDWAFVLPVCLALAGACSFLYGSVLLLLEARAAVVSTLEEMEYARELVTGEAGPRATG